MNATTRGRLLICDNEIPQMKALCATLELEGCSPTGYSSARQALATLRSGEVDVLLTDLQMPEMDGIALLEAVHCIDPDFMAVVITGHGTIDTAVKAMRNGALDYILRPFKLSTVLPVIERTQEIRRLRLEKAAMAARKRAYAYIAKLEAANRELDAFTWLVSHDWCAPLRTVKGFCELFLADYGQHVPLGRTCVARARRERRHAHGSNDRGSLPTFPLQPSAVAKGAGRLNCWVERVLLDLQAQNPGRDVELPISN